MIPLNILPITLSLIKLIILLLSLQTMNYVTAEERYHKTELVMFSFFPKNMKNYSVIKKQTSDLQNEFVITGIRCSRVENVVNIDCLL